MNAQNRLDELFLNIEAQFGKEVEIDVGLKLAEIILREFCLEDGKER